MNVATPTNGELILTVALSYPLPAFVISIEVIVPAADTIAVADAPTFISPEVTRASTVLNDKL